VDKTIRIDENVARTIQDSARHVILHKVAGHYDTSVSISGYPDAFQSNIVVLDDSSNL